VRHEGPSQATSILLVEQRARQSLEISHRGYILDSGKVVLHLLANPVMARLYLGNA
jgi:ABC-type branched-subunit amino acid transport system ATPase component